MSADQHEIEVRTASGPIVGTARGAVHRFLGVPYAEPIGAAERFRPARPKQPWTTPLRALEVGPVAVQHGLGGGRRAATREQTLMSEHAQTLHVWAPAHVDARAPVIVWLHGGGWYIGAPYGPETDGEELARTAGVVVVSITHRIGLLGTLYLGDHLGDDYAHSGTATVDDLLLALQWIQDHIADFGGDPDRVTIMGCSGGGAKVASLLTAPAARQLFARAVLQSGSAEHYLSIEEGIELTDAVLEFAGLRRDQAAELLTLDPDVFVEAQVELFRRSPWTPILGTCTGLLPFPTINGHTLVDLPRRSFDPDDQRLALVGSAYDEAMLPISRMRIPQTIDRDRLAELVRPNLGDVTEEVIAHYERRLPGASPYELLVRLGSDVESARAHRVASARADVAPTRMYRVDWGSDFYDGRPRACHCIEISLAFRNAERDPELVGRPGVDVVSGHFSTMLVELAGGADDVRMGGAAWPLFDAADQTVMRVDVEPTATAQLHRDVVELWAPYLDRVRR